MLLEESTGVALLNLRGLCALAPEVASFTQTRHARVPRKPSRPGWQLRTEVLNTWAEIRLSQGWPETTGKHRDFHYS